MNQTCFFFVFKREGRNSRSRLLEPGKFQTKVDHKRFRPPLLTIQHRCRPRRKCNKRSRIRPLNNRPLRLFFFFFTYAKRAPSPSLSLNSTGVLRYAFAHREQQNPNKELSKGISRAPHRKITSHDCNKHGDLSFFFVSHSFVPSSRHAVYLRRNDMPNGRRGGTAFIDRGPRQSASSFVKQQGELLREINTTQREPASPLPHSAFLRPRRLFPHKPRSLLLAAPTIGREAVEFFFPC